MRSDVVRLFQTLPHACGYFAERTAQNLVIDPSAPQLPQLYDLAVLRGYRRAGGHVYYPHCGACKACNVNNAGTCANGLNSAGAWRPRRKLHGPPRQFLIGLGGGSFVWPR